MRISNVGKLKALIEEKTSIADFLRNEMGVEFDGKRRSFKINCPFHEDRTPSFQVSVDKGRFRCFGAECGVSGDIFDLVQLYDGVDFIGSVQRLAKFAGIDLSPFLVAPTAEEKKLLFYYSVNRRVAEFFHRALLDSDMAKAYAFEERKHNEEIAKKFLLGYSSSPQKLISSLKKTVGLDVLKMLELDRSDVFTDSIVFPLFAPTGEILGFNTRPFSGRPKYTGTSDKTPTFDSSKRIYGMHLAKRALRVSDGALYLVEGQHDVITLHQNGITNVVAVLGGALNESQLKGLSEYKVRTIVMCPDGDVGEPKIMEMVKKFKSPMLLKIAVMPDMGDPDDYTRENGGKAMAKIFNEALSIPEFVIGRSKEKFNLKSVTGKLDFLRDVAPYFLTLTKLEREITVKAVSEIIGVAVEEVEDFWALSQAQGEVQFFSVDTEMIVLAEMILDVGFALENVELIDRSDFSLRKHQVIFDAVKSLMGSSIAQINMAVICDALRNMGKLEDFGPYVTDLENHRSTSPDFYVKDLKEKGKRRKIRDLAMNLFQKNADVRYSPDEAVEDHLLKMSDVVVHKDRGTLVTAETQVGRTMDLIYERMREGNEIVGLDPGPEFPKLAKITRGFQRHRVYVVMAPQGHGKTNLVMDWIVNISIREKIPTAWFALEMDESSMTMRFLSKLSGIPFEKIEIGDLNEQDEQKLRAAALKMAAAPLHMYCGPMSIEHIVSLARNLKYRHGVEMLVIDYIQLIRSSGGGKSGDSYNTKGDISQSIVNDIAMSKDIGFPVIVISQGNRDSAMEKGLVTTEHVSDSYRIAMDASVFFTFQKMIAAAFDSSVFTQGNANRILNIDKNRFGKSAILYVKFDENSLGCKEVDDPMSAPAEAPA